jgi:CheY-like chemotaxis protein
MNSLLLVEDDPIIAQIYERKLKSEGFEVTHVADGELAIEHVKVTVPDIVLLDLQLPKKNGIDVLEFIRANEPSQNLPVVVFTNSYLGSLVQAAWKAGATTCLTKAVCTPKQVSDVLRACLAGDDSGAGLQKAQLAAAPPPDVPAVAPTVDEDLIPMDPALFRPAEPPKEKSEPAPAPPASEPITMAPPVAPAAPIVTPPTSAPQSTAPAAPNPLAAPTGRQPRGLRNMRMPAHMQMITKSMVAPAAERAAEAEYEADLKSDFVTTLPAALAYLRQRLQEFTKNESDTTSLRWAEDRSAILFDMYRKMHGISAGAGAAGCARIARLSLAFEALLTEMSEDQDKINPSTVRTVAHTVDFLATVFDRAMDSEGNEFTKVNILVVDDEPLSRKAVMRGLEKADLTAKDVADPHVAAGLAGNESFNLVFLDIDMPGMDGYELCKRVRETPGNKKTPVIFVTGLTDFMTKAKSSLSGGNDLIGKPFLPVELAIKALTYLLKSRFD